MYGLVNRALQRFICSSYGDAAWAEIAQASGLRHEAFEPLLLYPDDLTGTIVAAAAERLRQAPDELLEDLGTFLVSHPSYEAARRLLRFGGSDFVELLQSLDDLPDRARLALPGLDFPRISVDMPRPGRIVLVCGQGLPGFSRVLTGLLRGLADDYGTLAMIDHAGAGCDEARITVDIHNTSFARARRFDLAIPVMP
jgi:hypothetical protein